MATSFLKQILESCGSYVDAVHISACILRPDSEGSGSNVDAVIFLSLLIFAGGEGLAVSADGSSAADILQNCLVDDVHIHNDYLQSNCVFVFTLLYTSDFLRWLQKIFGLNKKGGGASLDSFPQGAAAPVPITISLVSGRWVWYTEIHPQEERSGRS